MEGVCEMRNQTEITYRQVNDYLIPNLILPPEEVNIKLDKWGMLHKEYLRKHKPVVFATLLTQGTLWQYLAEIDEFACCIFENLLPSFQKKLGVCEQLKETNPLEWIRRSNIIISNIEEIIIQEINK